MNYAKTMRSIVLASAILIALSFPAAADRIPVRVVGVHDGDTIYVLTAAHRRLKIRLVSIDAPELDQPFDTDAGQILAGMVYGRDVDLERVGRDRYGRPFAEVEIDGQDINAAMVATGAAWADRLNAGGRVLAVLQADATAHKRGLWALPTDQIEKPRKYGNAGTRSNGAGDG